MSHSPVRRTLVVNAPMETAFEVFTQDIDSWWPRTHHIGKSAMRRIAMEPHAGGRCYSEHVDGAAHEWGRVLAWEPPHRLVLAWLITHEWGYQPEVLRGSEVEVRFSPLGGGATQVELEHRFFDRHGDGGEAMQAAVDAPNGWTLVLQTYAKRVAA